MLTLCDGTGHTLPSVDCGAVALCDATAEKCSDWGRLSVGVGRACAIDDSHGLHCWGNNQGQPLAGGSLILDDIHLMFPQAQPVAGISAWQISVADSFQCALQENGDVTCWGLGPDGELGLAPSGDAGLNPQVALPLPAVEVGAAPGCGCARLDDGSVWCWGLGDHGCLGTASTLTSGAHPTPMNVALASPAVQIRIGEGSKVPSCARLVTGEVQCWDVDFPPTLVPGVDDATDIAVANSTVFIQRPSGLYWSTPVLSGSTVVPGAATAFPNVASVTWMGAGELFCAVATTGELSCTDLSNEQAPVTAFPTSVAVTPPAGTITEIAAGYTDLYAASAQCLRLAGVPFEQSVYCWGADRRGVLGIGGPDYPTSPQAVSGPGLTQPVASVTCSKSSTAVVVDDGTVHYWGDGTTYLSSGTARTTPSASLTALGTNNLLLRANDGEGLAYALRVGAAPELVFNGSTEVNQRLLSYSTTNYLDALPGLVDFGLLANHQVILYADPWMAGGMDPNACGIFGDGTTTSPQNVPHLGSVSVFGSAIAAYVDPLCPMHACVIDLSGGLWCWGSNDYGESGVDTATPTPVVTAPTQVVVAGVTQFTSVSKGSNFTCATDGSAGTGQVYCWGRNDHGQLGLNPVPDYTIQTAVPAPVLGINNDGAAVPAVGVAAGVAHACAWLQDGTARCWGQNDFGQLGNGDFDDQGAPVAVLGLTGVVSMSLGDGHTCALLSGGSVSCWGDSYSGQVGAGISGQVATPTMVQGL